MRTNAENAMENALGKARSEKGERRHSPTPPGRAKIESKFVCAMNSPTPLTPPFPACSYSCCCQHACQGWPYKDCVCVCVCLCRDWKGRATKLFSFYIHMCICVCVCFCVCVWVCAMNDFHCWLPVSSRPQDAVEVAVTTLCVCASNVPKSAASHCRDPKLVCPLPFSAPSAPLATRRLCELRRTHIFKYFKLHAPSPSYPTVPHT